MYGTYTDMIRKFNLQSFYDDLQISVMGVIPDGYPHAVLQLAHGMRGCKERFLPFMSYMAEQGIACVANDHRGHGESVREESDRGYMYDGGYRALVDDMKMVTDWTHCEYPGLPVYILGHSMGSLAVRTYLKEYDGAVDGVILCGSPGWTPLSNIVLSLSHLLAIVSKGRYRPSLIQKWTSSLYNRRFSDEGRNAWTCSDPEVRKEFAENPVCSFDFTANGMEALLSLMHETYSDKDWHVTSNNLPIYFVSGEDDPCMLGESGLHEAAKHLVACGYKDVTSALYSSMRHEVLNEKGKELLWEDIFQHITTWEQTRMSKAGS